MPLYGYKCLDCGATHEALQKISDDPLTTCPACGKETLKKQLSAASFQLKGTGWYATDFKHSGQPPKPAADSSTDKPASNDSSASASVSTGD